MVGQELSLNFGVALRVRLHVMHWFTWNEFIYFFLYETSLKKQLSPESASKWNSTNVVPSLMLICSKLQTNCWKRGLFASHQRIKPWPACCLAYGVRPFVIYILFHRDFINPECYINCWRDIIIYFACGVTLSDKGYTSSYTDIVIVPYHILFWIFLSEYPANLLVIIEMTYWFTGLEA